MSERYGGAHGVECDKALASMMDRECPLAIPPSAMFWWGNAFKYVWRWPFKGGSADIDKAIDCLERTKSAMYGGKTDGEG